MNGILVSIGADDGLLLDTGLAVHGGHDATPTEGAAEGVHGAVVAVAEAGTRDPAFLTGALRRAGLDGDEGAAVTSHPLRAGLAFQAVDRL